MFANGHKLKSNFFYDFSEIEFILPNPYSLFKTDDEGRIYIMTYERVEKTEELFYDVFDSDGKCLVKIPLNGTPRVIKKNKLYTIELDEEGFLTVKRYRIDSKI